MWVDPTYSSNISSCQNTSGPLSHLPPSSLLKCQLLRSLLKSLSHHIITSSCLFSHFVALWLFSPLASWKSSASSSIAAWHKVGAQYILVDGRMAKGANERASQTEDCSGVGIGPEAQDLPPPCGRLVWGQPLSPGVSVSAAERYGQRLNPPLRSFGKF